MFYNSSNSSRAMEIFHSGVGADCVVEVVQDGQQDKKAMFNHKNTQEVREGRIQIMDSTGTAVRQMLIYMYTGELSTEYAIETDAGPLMHIANKYQIKALAKMIEQRLVNSLSLKNVFDRLEMADLYQLKSLCSSCGRLIRRKLKMVKKDTKWLELKKKAPELAFAILEDVDEFGNSDGPQSQQLRNPEGIAWSRSNAEIIISNDGLNASRNPNGFPFQNVYAEKGFPICVADCRTDDFPGTICYYYEVKILKSAEHWFSVGLTDGIPRSGNSYYIGIPNPNTYEVGLVGQRHYFECLEPEQRETGNVYGCGILMNPDDKLTIFFTVNGILINRQFPIDPTVDHLFPTVTLWDDMSLEANFGDNSAKPFEYDIKKCPGMGLEWI